MTSNNKMNFTLHFNSDNSLQRAIKDLETIKHMSIGKFMELNPKLDVEQAKKELMEVRRSAAEVESALTKAFNPNLNTTNIVRYNRELNKLNLDKIYANFNKVGMAGEQAAINMTGALMQTNTKAKESQKLLDSLAVSFKNTIKWGISSSVWNAMTGSLSKAWSFTKNLDKSLNNIRIVSGESAENMEKFAIQANKSAQALGVSTQEYTDAALIYYQQGLSADQVKERTEITLKMANVLGTSATEVSNYMTAIWSNFDDGTKSLEYYSDVITALGATTASSAEEIAGGLEKFAAIGQTIGLSYEYATAMLTTITAETRQSEEVVGTALKTILARIQGLSLGETLDDGTDLNKYSLALAKVGIAIKDANGELRNADDILDDIGARWQTLSKAQQVALAQEVAGVRQYNQLVSLMDNWSVMENNLQTAYSAEGTLNKQQEIRMDSMAAHLKKLQTAEEGFLQNFTDSDSMNGVIDAFTTILNLADGLVDSIGGGGNAFLMFGSIALQVMRKQVASGLTTVIENLKTARTNTELWRLEMERVSKISMSKFTPSEKENESTQKNIEEITKVWNDVVGQAITKGLSSEVISLIKQMFDKWIDQYLEVQKEKLKAAESFNFLQEYSGVEEENGQRTLFNIYSESGDWASLREKIQSNRLILQNLVNDLTILNGNWVSISKQIEEIVTDTDTWKNNLFLNNNDNWREELRKNLNSETNILQNMQNKVDKDKIKVSKETDINYKIALKKLQNATEKDSKESKEDVEKLLANFKNALKKYMDEIGGQIDQVIDTAIHEIPEIHDVKNTPFKSVENPKKNIKQPTKDSKDNWVDLAGRLEQSEDKANKTKEEMGGTVHNAIDAQFTENIVNAVAATGQLISGLNSVANIVDIINNKDLNWGEKILQGSSAIFTGLPIAIQGYLSLSKSLDVILTKEKLIAIQTKLHPKNILKVITARNKEAVATKAVATASKNIGGTVTLIITAITTIITIISKIINGIKEAEAAAEEARQKTIEEEQAKQKELKANIDLYNSWEKIYDKYKAGTASKEEMVKVTDDLVKLLKQEDIEVAKLSGNYDYLNNKILEARKTAAKETLESAKLARKTGEIDFAKKWKGGSRYILKDVDSDKDLVSGYLKEYLGTDQLRQIYEQDVFRRYQPKTQVIVGTFSAYEQLTKMIDEINKNSAEEQRENDPNYKAITKYLNDNQEIYKKQKELLQSEGQAWLTDQFLNIDWDNKTYTQIQNMRKKALEVSQTKYGNTEEEARDIVDSTLRAVGNAKLNNQITKIENSEKLKGRLQTITPEKIDEIVEGLTTTESSMLVSFELNPTINEEGLKKAIQEAKDMSVATLSDGTAILLENIQSGKITAENIKQDENFKKLIEEAETLKELYPEITEQVDNLSKIWLVGTEDYKDSLRDVQDAIFTSKMNTLGKDFDKELKDLQNDSGKVDIKLKLENGQFQKELKDLMDQDYKINVALTTEATQEFNTAKAQLDEISKQASLIGENFIVSAENAATLNDVFPGILNNAEITAEGTIQLQQEATQKAIDYANEELDNDIEKSKGELELLKRRTRA